MPEALLWIILAVTAVTATLAIIQLMRATKTSTSAGREVRDELRLSREEARSAGWELREEVAGGLKSTNEVLSQTLESLGKLKIPQA